jgi:gliding motility-associated-like protein
MKIKQLYTFMVLLLFLIPKVSKAQAPSLGSAASYALYSTGGAVTNGGTIFKTRITGNIGTSSNPTMPGFGNIDGNITDVSDLTLNTQLDLDILDLYAELAIAVPEFFPAPLLGNGQTLVPGTYDIAGPTTLNLDLILDGQNDPNSVFIIKIGGAFSSSSNAKVKLINGALACNVFWKIEGLTSLATGTSMKGTMVVNNAAIDLAVGDTLEGRAFSIEGAITVSELFAYLPTGCSSPILTGPIAPNLGSAGCFALFSSNGVNTNVGITNVTGDVGTNGASDLTTGYDPLLVNGNIHPIPDLVTDQAATDLLAAYNYLVGLDPGDIELVRPDLFGHNLVLTPHTYLMLAAVTFTDTVYLDARGQADAVFVINVNGAFSSSVNSRVVLINGAQAKNVYWKVDGVVTIADNSIFNGTLVVAGAINLNTGVLLNGRAITISGALNVQAITAIMPTSCAPLITTEPSNQTVCLGDPAIFSVTAEGLSLTYQWRIGNVALVDGGNISGATTSTLTIDPTNLSDEATNYNILITGSYSPTVTSTDVSLTINTFPTITSQPTDQTVCLGDPASFSVIATGTNLTYQWKKGLVDVVVGGAIIGATTSTLTIDPTVLADAGLNYNVVVSGTCPTSATSNNAALIFNAAPAITSQPTDQTVCLGDPASFSITATGTNLTYQWRKGLIDVVDGVSVSGATTATLTIDPTVLADAGLNYNVVVSGTCPTGATSNNVALIFNTAPIITSQPTDQTVCLGDPASFSVTATGTNLTYQWRKGLVDLLDGGAILGATTATLTIDPTVLADAGLNYNVVVSGTCPTSATSNNAALIFNTAPSITSQPTDQTVCLGDPASFSVTANGTNLTYQWRKGLIDVVDGGAILGATTATLTIDPTVLADAGLNYNVVVSGTCPTSTTSNVAALIFNLFPTITSQPTDQTVCLGDPASFSVTANGTNLTYQWRKGLIDVVDGGAILGATTATLTIDPTVLADAGLNYNVVVSGTCPTSTTSNVAALIFNLFPTITSQPTDQTVCLGDPASFSVTANGTNLTYQWRKGLIDVVDGGAILGATTTTLTIDPTVLVDAGLNYNVVVSGTCPTSTTSNDAALIFNLFPTITSQPSNQTVCEGDLASFSVTANGTNLTYQWRKGLVDLLDGGAILGATTATLTIDPTVLVDAGLNYNVVVSGACPTSTTSNDAALIFNLFPTITSQPSNQTVCEGDLASFSVTANGTNLTYQWRKGIINIVNGATISGATSSILTIDPTVLGDAALDYNVQISGTCPLSASSNNVSLSITPTPIAIASSNSPTCEGATLNLMAETVVGATYSWTATNGFTASTQNVAITPAIITNNGVYSLVVTVNACPSIAAMTTVEVIKCDTIDFFIPEGFSPNNDGVNDLFVIRGIQYFPNNSFTIFNRWGNKVYEANAYMNTWDGSSSEGVSISDGKLPVGTYFYLLDLGNDDEVLKGTIYLNK